VKKNHERNQSDVPINETLPTLQRAFTKTFSTPTPVIAILCWVIQRAELPIEMTEYDAEPSHLFLIFVFVLLVISHVSG
jgi:hypothetical protein